jgi:hypothetical protein
MFLKHTSLFQPHSLVAALPRASPAGILFDFYVLFDHFFLGKHNLFKLTPFPFLLALIAHGYVTFLYILTALR